eukprot:scaffold3841_cov412-Prasinococcus_capsulatus_cf.AAC.8
MVVLTPTVKIYTTGRPARPGALLRRWFRATSPPWPDQPYLDGCEELYGGPRVRAPGLCRRAASSSVGIVKRRPILRRALTRPRPVVAAAGARPQEGQAMTATLRPRRTRLHNVRGGARFCLTHTRRGARRNPCGTRAPWHTPPAPACPKMQPIAGPLAWRAVPH